MDLVIMGVVCAAVYIVLETIELIINLKRNKQDKEEDNNG